MIIALFALALTACGSPPPAPEPAPVAPVIEALPSSASPTKETSAGYAIGVKKIVKDRAELQALLDAGKLADLHRVAEEIASTAKALPDTCESLGGSQHTDVVAQVQKLQDLFGPIDEAGDAGKQEEATAAAANYDAPIAALVAYLP